MLLLALTARLGSARLDWQRMPAPKKPLQLGQQQQQQQQQQRQQHGETARLFSKPLGTIDNNDSSSSSSNNNNNNNNNSNNNNNNGNNNNGDSRATTGIATGNILCSPIADQSWC